MGGVAFAVVQTGSFNNPKEPLPPLVSGVFSTGSTSANVIGIFGSSVPCNGGSAVNPGGGLLTITATANTGQTSTIPFVPGGNDFRKIDVNGLTANTVYSFTLTSTNAQGRSRASAVSGAITTQTIAEAPVIGTITTTCTSASVPITMPTFTGGNTITSTTVSATPDPGGILTSNIPGSSPFTQNYTGLLSPLTTYTFSAYVTTPIGTGRTSSKQATTTGPVTIYYNIVAGGGGGGGSSFSGGSGFGGGQIGGGGGGGGGVLQGSLTLAPGSVLTAYVGTGGAGGTTNGAAPKYGDGTNGVASILCHPGGQISATGGGYGAGWSNSRPVGGSGGGGGGNGGGGTAVAINSTQPNTAGFTTGPGGPGLINFPGGSGTGSAGGPPFPASVNGGGGGGGGGAGGAGGAGVAGPNIPFSPLRTGAGGAGGAGKIWPYTGPATFYGAGGGGAQVTTPTAGPAAPGGGTTYGRGGAGGGPVNASTPGTAGSTGTVMIAIPTPQYKGSPGAPGLLVTNPPFAPGLTVLQWTTPGGGQTYTV
jgi:hypothetical protein